MIRLHVSEMTAGLQVTLKNSTHNYNTYCILPLCEKTALNHILEMQVCTLLHNFYSLHSLDLLLLLLLLLLLIIINNK